MSHPRPQETALTTRAAGRGDAGLLVLLDLHVLQAGVWPDGGRVSMRARTSLFAAWAQLGCDRTVRRRQLLEHCVCRPQERAVCHVLGRARPRSRAPRHHSTKQRTSGMRWLPRWGLRSTGVVPAGPSSCRALARALACAGRSMTQPRRARLGHTTTLCDTPSAPGQQDMSTPTRQAFGRVRTCMARGRT